MSTQSQSVDLLSVNLWIANLQKSQKWVIDRLTDWRIRDLSTNQQISHSVSTQRQICQSVCCWSVDFVRFSSSRIKRSTDQHIWPFCLSVADCNICWFVNRSAICQSVDLLIAHLWDFWRLAINRLTDSRWTDLTLWLLACPHKVKSVHLLSVNLLIAHLQKSQKWAINRLTDWQIADLSTNQQISQSATDSWPGTKLQVDSPASLLGWIWTTLLLFWLLSISVSLTLTLAFLSNSACCGVWEGMAMTSVPARQPPQNQGDAAGAHADSTESGAGSSSITVEAILAANQADANGIFQCRLQRVGVAMMVML